MNASSPVAGWIPVKLQPTDDDLLCRWMYAGDKAFSEPFFDETIAACRSLYETNWHMKRSMSTCSALAELAQQTDAVEPSAFIFHISRCGSTLITQMLGMQPCNILLSEVPFFDELLRYGKLHGCMPDMLTQLRAAIALYGARRNEQHRHLFIKTDSWHIHFYKELRTLYPAAPFFLLYRKPDEVLRSQQKKRGMQALPNYLEPAIFGFDKTVIAAATMDEYMGMVIESYLDAFVRILQNDTNAYALNYHDGAMEMIETIAAVTRLPITAGEKKAMQERAGFHAKFPGQLFSEEKDTGPVPDFLKKSFGLYEQLESIRLQKR